jgi:hypothetical protein
MNQSQPLWNSLEIAKLIISTLTPIIVLVIGLWINRSVKRLEHLQWTNQKITEKRIAVFDELAPLLNDLLCYFAFVGCWKDFTPPDVVKLKRKMDRIVHVNAPLFSKGFLNKYYDFTNVCYSTYTGWGQDAKLRTAWERREEAAEDSWDVKWGECFADKNNCIDPKLVKSTYVELMSGFSKELGVGLDSDHVPAGQIPANIR